MEQPDDIRAAQERFAKLVEEYDPKEHNKEHPLEPFTDHIRSLREQGVSYKAVKHLLEQVDVSVCIATVARFCQARELHPPKKKSAKKSRKRIAQSPPKITKQSHKKADLSSLSKRPENESPPSQPKRKRGPRIANPNDI